jgi:hypothetical protein
VVGIPLKTGKESGTCIGKIKKQAKYVEKCLCCGIE